MTRLQLETAIFENATFCFNDYPECYPIENGLATDEAVINAQEIAISYYNETTEHENETGLNQIDYLNIVMSAFENWVQKQLS
jgi:hypothetical protein